MLKKITKIYGVDDAKIFPITDDSSERFSCSDAVEIEGIKQVSFDFEIESKDLTGDEMTLDTISKIKAVTFNFEVAKLNLDALAVLSGGKVTTTGTGETEKVVYSLGSNAVENQKYFQFQAQIKTTDNSGGDLHFLVYKAKATATPINGVENDYATYTIDAKGVFSEHEFDGERKLMDIILNAKTTDLSAKVSA